MLEQTSAFEAYRHRLPLIRHRYAAKLRHLPKIAKIHVRHLHENSYDADTFFHFHKLYHFSKHMSTLFFIKFPFFCNFFDSRFCGTSFRSKCQFPLAFYVLYVIMKQMEVLSVT